MMRIEYDSPLIENAVFLASRRDAGQDQALHRAIDGLYDVADQQQREQAFHQAYSQAFTALGLDKAIPQFLAERPLIGALTGKCVVHQAACSKAEAAQLYIRPGFPDKPAPADRTVVIHVCPESLVDPDQLTHRMRRELLHVSDMLDTRFEYDRSTFSRRSGPETVVYDRYRVLWDIYVEARLIRQEMVSPDKLPELRRALSRALTYRAVPPEPGVFDELMLAQDLTHQQLLQWASNPLTILNRQEPDQSSTDGPDPGSSCPFCDFPTFDWYPIQDGIDQTLLATLRKARPDWQPLDGACRQCVETYMSMQPFRTPGSERCPVQ